MNYVNYKIYNFFLSTFFYKFKAIFYISLNSKL